MLRKHRSALLLLACILSAALTGPAAAAELQDWLSHGFGSVRVFSQLIREDEEVLLMDGVLHFAYPRSFQVEYYSEEGPVTITGHNGFLEVQTGGDVQYSYERYWLFEDFANYLFALADYARRPWKFSGVDQVAGCEVKRYTAEGDPELILWLHEQSGLPFLLRQGKRTLVSVFSFIRDGEQTERITSVELELFLTKETAILQFDLGEDGWLPVRLTVKEPLGEVHTTFRGWSFREKWEDNPFRRLDTVRELNDQYFACLEEENWERALAIAQELLAAAPQFWQGYLYQAFAYEHLDNYLGVVENYQQVLMRQPDNHLALNNLAYHYLLREVNISKAIEMAERAVELERRAVYLDTLGYGYYLVGRLEEAKKILEEALATAPEEAVDEISGHLQLVLNALGEAE
ncbi:MAG TPA: hypothetical protein PLM25_02940 [Limnochordia bacterium]|nr:hypothetical protein [Limnochordia bacterium]